MFTINNFRVIRTDNEPGTIFLVTRQIDSSESDSIISSNLGKLRKYYNLIYCNGSTNGFNPTELIELCSDDKISGNDFNENFRLGLRKSMGQFPLQAYANTLGILHSLMQVYPTVFARKFGIGIPFTPDHISSVITKYVLVQSKVDFNLEVSAVVSVLVSPASLSKSSVSQYELKISLCGEEIILPEHKTIPAIDAPLYLAAIKATSSLPVNVRLVMMGIQVTKGTEVKLHSTLMSWTQKLSRSLIRVDYKGLPTDKVQFCAQLWCMYLADENSPVPLLSFGSRNNSIRPRYLPYIFTCIHVIRFLMNIPVNMPAHVPLYKGTGFGIRPSLLTEGSKPNDLEQLILRVYNLCIGKGTSTEFGVFRHNVRQRPAKFKTIHSALDYFSEVVR